MSDAKTRRPKAGSGDPVGIRSERRRVPQVSLITEVRANPPEFAAVDISEPRNHHSCPVWWGPLNPRIGYSTPYSGKRVA